MTKNHDLSEAFETLTDAHLLDINGADRGYVRKPDGTYVNVPVNPSRFGEWYRGTK
ncbi:MAG TPA: hypothetical protein VGO00_28850 [Kofleriaceae bacterium]|jgi:hypothetical protein|nr:hypothetical protein [Kofleriaceae bacterium]